MSKRMLWTVLLVIGLVWAATAMLVSAGSQGIAARPAGQLAQQGPQDEPTVPAEPSVQLDVTLTGGPARFCPGWNLYYTLRLTNTHPSQALTNLIITDAVPLGAWYAPGGMGGTISGTFDAENNLLVWQAPSLAAGQWVEVQLTLHSYSSLPSGVIVTNTFSYAGDQLEQPGLAELGLLADASVCPTRTPTRTNTPTRTPTATETATPTATATVKPGGVYLPLIRSDISR